MRPGNGLKPYEQRGWAVLNALPDPDAYRVRVAEIGVWRGDMSGYLLRNCIGLELHMVDRWSPVSGEHPYHDADPVMGKASETQFQRAEEHAKKATDLYRGRRIIHKGESVEIARMMDDAFFDLIFLDADHRYEAVLDDLKAWSRKVRRGGVIGGHDWDHPYKQWGVRQAVEDFFPGRGVMTSINRTWFVKV